MTLPTITLDTGHVFRCENARWVAVYGSGKMVDTKMYPYAFLILLEYGLEELSGLAAQAFADADATREYVPLPIEDIIRAGLTAWGQWWPALGLEHAARFSGVAALECEISALVKTGKTQSIRHNALKLRARIRRERGERSGSPRSKSCDQ